MNEMSDRQALASLFKKKAAVMHALEGGMEKKGNNTHFGYKFVTASDIKRAVSQLFAQHGLSLQMSGIEAHQATILATLKGGGTKETAILRIQFSISLCDVDTGAMETSLWFGEAGATDDKAASKAATSALKYYLISNLMIADKDEDKRDTDRDANKRRPAPTETPQAPANAPHWSMDATRLQALYEKAYTSFNIIEKEVKAIIAASGKPITSLTEKEVWALVSTAAKKVTL